MTFYGDDRDLTWQHGVHRSGGYMDELDADIWTLCSVYAKKYPAMDIGCTHTHTKSLK